MNGSDLGPKVRRRARVLRRRLRGSQPAAPVSGMVEEFTRKVLVGWVSVPANTPPTRVTLCLDDLEVASTYASPGAAMSGIHVAADGAVTRPRARVEDMPGDRWRSPPIKGPPGDRRNSRQQIRTFSLRISGIWPYVDRSTRVTVRVDGRPLPIYRHGMFLRRRRSGGHTVDDLRRKLEQGFVLSQMGKLQLSKQLDTAWQRSAMELYTLVRTIVAEEHGYDVFVTYGTLLGAVREGTYIGHDPDFDAAYVSRLTNGPDAAEELAQIGLTLIGHGLGADLRSRLLHVFDPRNDDFHIDLFHTYFHDGVHRFPFGVAGTSTLLQRDWSGTEEIDFGGGRVLVPRNAVAMVAHLYGEDWRLPRPGFNWHLERTDHAPEGHTTDEQRSKVYWANFYAHTEYTSGSSFFEVVNARPDMPDTVVDLGCGDGRDSCAFGAAGRTVLGLDQSPVGIEHARLHAVQSAVSDRVRFQVCDVADVDQLGAALDAVVQDTGGPVLFYLRFFLHAIPARVQERMLDAVVVHSRPGDLLAAEFRTDKDETTTKVHGNHYRRFQNAEEFRDALTKRLGFEVLFEIEDTGLSPYGGEDPVLYRVVALRRD